VLCNWVIDAGDSRRPDLPEGAQYVVLIDHGDTCEVDVRGSDADRMEASLHVGGRSARIAHRRWQAEIGGCAWEGYRLDTSRAGRATYLAARDRLVRVQGSAKWKTLDGQWVNVDAADLDSMIVALEEHIKACFTREFELLSDADADIDSGWPK